MPFKVERFGNKKYKVVNQKTGETYSIKYFPTKEKANKQLKAIQISYYNRSKK